MSEPKPGDRPSRERLVMLIRRLIERVRARRW